MSEAIVPVSSVRDDLALARELIPTGFLPAAIKTPGQAVAIIMTGRELGVPAMQALRMISIVQGKPSIAPELLLALAYQKIQGFSHSVVESTAEKCSIKFKRPNTEEYTHTFTAEDAKKMGLWGKDNWQKQPATMLRWRCVSAGLRIFAPDVTLGAYIEGEIEAHKLPEPDPLPIRHHVVSDKGSEGAQPDGVEEARADDGVGGDAPAPKRRGRPPKEAHPDIPQEEGQKLDAPRPDGEHMKAWNELSDAFLRFKSSGDQSLTDEKWWIGVTHFEKNGKVYESTSMGDAEAFFLNTYKKYGKAPNVFAWRRDAEKAYPHLFEPKLEELPEDKIPF